MIGRGIFKNPFAFEKEKKEHTHKESLDLLRLHLDLFDQYAEQMETRPFKTLRRFFKIYVKGFRGAGELRNRLMMTETTDEVRELIQRIYGLTKHLLSLVFKRRGVFLFRYGFGARYFLGKSNNGEGASYRSNN